MLKNHRRKSDTFWKKCLDTSLETLNMLPMDTHAIDVNFKLLGDLAAAYGLTAYDMPYFHLARMLELPMVSRHRGIISACKGWNVVRWTPG